MQLALSSQAVAQFGRNGFLAPVPLFSAGQCEFIRRHLGYGHIPKPLGWGKGRFATDRVMYDLGVRPALLVILRSLLGENFVLWGADVLVRDPGHVHPWHTDIESSAQGQRFISVWIGIKNTSRDSALKLISRSHTFGTSLQEAASERDVRRGEASDQMVLAWARERHADATLIQPEMRDGDAIVFNGALWHGSDHAGKGRRIALLFQYAVAGTPIRMPDLTQLEWPFRYRAERVPIILISGSGGAESEYTVAPPEENDHKISVKVFAVKLPLLGDQLKGWRPHHLFRGATSNTQAMAAHISVLSPGHSPHPPHAHRDEEILIVLDGNAELIIAKTPDAAAPHIEHLPQGCFVFYPAYQHHTIRNPTSKPITYLMFKWYGAPAETERLLRTTKVNMESLQTLADAPFSAITLLEGPTAYLSKLQSHLTVLQPGAGYAAHSDEHDVAIVILAGLVQTMGRTVGPLGVIFYSAGEMHDMKNIGKIPARYLVFEFHAYGS